MSLNTLFYPKSVALIGASKDDGSVGNEIAKNLASQGYKGKVFFVNPKGGKLFGKKVLKSTAKLPKNLELAVFAIPGQFVLQEVTTLATKGLKSAVVISAGFREAGNVDAERELEQICTKNSISLIGPNCLGFLNAENKLNASFAPIMPQKGNVAFISQSGALLASVLDYALREGIGFSKVVSVGNKAQIGELELLNYLKNDSKTRIIAIYLEELTNSDKVKKLAIEITKNVGKPIIAIKAGKTDEGKKAALSHTGSLGGSDQAYEAFFKESGIIRANTIEELFNLIEIFQRSKTWKAKNVAIITNAGGPGVITADALIAKGLNLAKISPYTQKKLQKLLPKSASVKNPIDILGDADASRYENSIKTVLADSAVDALEVILTPQSTTEIEKTAQSIASLKKKTNKPIVATFMGQALVEPGVEILNRNSVTTTLFPEDSASSFAALNFFSLWKKEKKPQFFTFHDIDTKKARQALNSSFPNKSLPFENCFEILNAYGLPTVKRWVVKTPEEAKELALKLKARKYVLRIVSKQISHKSDVGGVMLGVTPDVLPKKYLDLIKTVKKKAPKAILDGVDVSEQIDSGGLELIVGVKTDPLLGKQILIGMGGIYTEVFQDVSWGLAPLTKNDIDRMLGSLKVRKIMAGYRGQDPLDVEKVRECTARLSQLSVDFPAIGEVDINPLVVNTDEAIALDARIVML